jgi:hypothetical protein
MSDFYDPSDWELDYDEIAALHEEMRVGVIKQYWSGATKEQMRGHVWSQHYSIPRRQRDYQYEAEAEMVIFSIMKGG